MHHQSAITRRQSIATNSTRLRLLPLLMAGLMALSAVSGCTTAAKRCPVATRPFNLQTDTPAYSNQLSWEYSFDTNGQWSAHKRVPKPDYALHCFVVARATERFFFNARFDPTLPVADLSIYRQLTAATLAGKSQQTFPGYANLKEFSRAQENLLKKACGGAWHSYFQRGNWRMIFPLTRSHQAKMATQLTAALKSGHLPLVHLARFPQQTINHCVLLYAVSESELEIRFTACDSNYPNEPMVLTYDRATRTFNWPRTIYFGGGRVDVYQVYHKWDY